MSQTDIATLLHGALMVALKLGGPPLLAALVVGLVVSLIQAVTQLNESTLVFVPKMLAIMSTLVLLGPFMMGALEAYGRLLFDRIVAIGAG
ncbi:MAG: flagellar biosynthesis protein FliQ [Rhodospirillales bacterium]|nr:flagellar biosynthesis protein FliQ [Rhodospirillales bacterium]